MPAIMHSRNKLHHCSDYGITLFGGALLLLLGIYALRLSFQIFMPIQKVTTSMGIGKKS